MLFLLWLVSCVLLCALRVIQYTTAYDATIGLFLSGTPIHLWLALCCGAVALLAVIGLLFSRRRPPTQPELAPAGKPTVFFCSLFGVISALYAMSLLIGMSEQTGLSISSAVMVLLALLLSVSAFLTAGALKRGCYRRSEQFMASFAMVYFTIDLISNYLANTEMATPWHYAFFVLSDVCFLLFFFYHARLMALGGRTGAVLSYGGAALCFGAAEYIPPILLGAVTSWPRTMLGIGALIYILTLCLHLSRQGNK